MIKPGAIVVDAGTASEGGHLVGDISDEIRARDDLAYVTPRIGGVGPLTVSVLFEDVLAAAAKNAKA
jgi:methylenetetrahydrofolate dehydrogenase (NADP+)/methenyltetrahydrofolate cyclohydrolase